MTDREMLELAAKAAGMDCTGWTDCFVSDPWDPSDGECGIELTDLLLWNPLNNDGDALRLAVRLQLFNRPEFFHLLSLERSFGQDKDEMVVVRRAIVRAAAEMGRASQ